MGAFWGCMAVAFMLAVLVDLITDKIIPLLERIANALKDKNENDKNAYLRFEQATEKSETLIKDPLLHIKHPGL